MVATTKESGRMMHSGRRWTTARRLVLTTGEGDATTVRGARNDGGMCAPTPRRGHPLTIRV